ncbi:MAG: MvaI/BcnI family restriction endonuclease [Gammaproteobacteria bacterium]|nr:MvaI/BcnI family restriction endonuclease [Gammaproteobacteria bacterium]
MNWTQEEITTKLAEVKGLGYVKSKRRGPTGVGFTLETLLGIKENNIHLPDLGSFELKAKREGHTGMTTLFTFNRAAWKIGPMEAIRRYGNEDKNGRLGLYQSVTAVPNNRGLHVSVDDSYIRVSNSEDQTILLEWSLTDVSERFDEKVGNLLLVKALVDTRDGAEYFNYHQAKLLSGAPTQQKLREKIRFGDVIIDLRLHDKGTKGARNHGTGFRVLEDSLEHLYAEAVELDI